MNLYGDICFLGKKDHSLQKEKRIQAFFSCWYGWVAGRRMGQKFLKLPGIILLGRNNFMFCAKQPE